MKKSGLSKSQERRFEAMIKVVKPEDELFVAGYITKGIEKGKFIAVKVRNTQLLNPVEPIFESYPGIEVMIVGKSEKVVKKYFKKLIN